MAVRACSIQRFKLAVAGTVLDKANSSLASLGTDKLLDLFVRRTPAPSAAGPAGEALAAAVAEAAGGGGADGSALRLGLEASMRADVTEDGVQSDEYRDLDVAAFVRSIAREAARM